MMNKDQEGWVALGAFIFLICALCFTILMHAGKGEFLYDLILKCQ